LQALIFIEREKSCKASAMEHCQGHEELPYPVIYNLPSIGPPQHDNFLRTRWDNRPLAIRFRTPSSNCGFRCLLATYQVLLVTNHFPRSYSSLLCPNFTIAVSEGIASKDKNLRCASSYFSDDLSPYTTPSLSSSLPFVIIYPSSLASSSDTLQALKILVRED
jgi:hypothetical protein